MSIASMFPGARRQLHRLATLLLLLPAAIASPAAVAPADDCVILSGASAKAAAQPGSIQASSDIGNLTVMDFDGDYDRDFDAPRRLVSQRFFQDHPDKYDFLVVFTTFDFEWGNLLAFYRAVRNDVSGIGWPLLDDSASYGSTRLQGYIDMTRTSRYALGPQQPGFAITRNTLAHELMHRWAAKLTYRTPEGAVSRDLLGESDAHWSYFLDTDASLMYGADWQQRGDGQFESSAISYRYGPLDLYAAGFAAAGEVPPLHLIRNGDGDPAAVPRLGAVSSGSLETITIGQIVAAEGPRIPDSANAPKELRAAMIVLKRPGDTLPAETLAGLEGLRVRVQQHFSQITDGRGTLRIFNQRRSADSAQLPAVLQGSGTAPVPPGVVEAVNWIKQRQKPDGHWEDRAATASRDTAAVLQLLRDAEPGFAGIAQAENWLAGRAPASSDEAAWKLVAGESAAAASLLQQSQSAAGGWGLVDGFADSSLDTAGIAAALAQRDPSGAALQRALQGLAAQRNADGSFGIPAQGRGRLLPTLRAARAFSASSLPEHATIASHATQWLLGRQQPGGGFGDGAVSLADSIELVDANSLLSLPPAIGNGARNYVFAAQQRQGDWQGSIYLTALAARAQLRDTKPNLALSGTPVAQPAQPQDGDLVRVQATAVNNGVVAAAASSARWYDGNPQQGGTPIGSDIAVPALIPGRSANLATLWDSSGRAGARELWLQLDATAALDELDEDDNRGMVALSVAAAPVQADIALEPTRLSLDPASVASLPATVTVSGSVANLGQTGATGVVIRLYRDGVPQQLLAETTLDIAGRSSAALSLSFEVSVAGTVPLRLRADPDNAIAEARENNNEASLLLPFGQSLDLEVRNADLGLLDGATPLQGRDTGIRVVVHNRGTIDSPPAQLLVQVQQGAVSQVLLDTPVQINGGASIERRLYWRPPSTGAASISVSVDGADVVAEANEANNQAQLSFEVQAAPDSVDLAIEADSLVFSPATALQGQPLQASLRLRNLGNLAAPPFAVVLYAADPRQGGAALARIDIADGLAAQSARDIVLPVAELGLSRNSDVFVTADALQQIAESDEGNNSASRPLSVLAYADAAVSAASIALTPMQPVPGEALRARVSVRNLGGQPASQLRVRLLEGNPGDGVAVGADQVIAELAAGATAELEWNWTFGLQPDTRALSVLADPLQQQRENDRANNTAVLPLQTQDSDFYTSERYLSPNGDGIRDSATLAFARLAPGPAQVEIRNGAGRVVRRFADALDAVAERGQVTWDGRDDAGRLELDGDYRASLIGGGRLLAGLTLTLDLNRSSLFSAAGTPLLYDRRIAQWPQWLQPPPLPPAQGYVYALIERSQIPPQNPQSEYGIYRSSIYWPALEPIVSSAALAPGQSIEGLDAQSFSADARHLAFLRRSAGQQELVVARSDVPDQLQVLDTLPLGSQTVRPRFIGSGQLIAGSDAGVAIYTLADGSKRELALPATPVTRASAYVHGAYLWSADAASGQESPARYYPADPAASPLDLPPSGRLNGAGSHLAVVRTTADSESAALLDSRDGSERLLYQRPREDYFSVHANGHYRPQHLYTNWLGEAQDRLLLIDTAARLVQVFASNGALLVAAQLPPADTTLDSEPPQGRFIGNEFRRIGGLGSAEECRNPLWHCTVTHWQETDPRLQWYDPAQHRLTLVLASDLVGAYDTEGGPPYVIGRFNGAVEAFAIDLDDGSFERVASASEYSALQWDAPPLLRLRDGAALGLDGRLRNPAGVAAALPWNYASATAAAAFSSDDRGLWLGSGTASQRHLSSLGNLVAQLRTSSRNGAIDLDGIAADHNFDHYRLDWASQAQPEQWHALALPSADPLLGDSFGSWVAPAPGHYQIRLTVVDQAGNSTRAYASALALAGTAITDTSIQSRYFSPNGDGNKDTAIASFRLAAAQSIVVRVRNADQQIVLEQVQLREPGENSFAWDGRDQAGLAQPDGNYSIDVQGTVLPVVLDTTPPQLRGEFEQPGLSFVGIDGSSRSGSAMAVRAEASDANFQGLWLERSPVGSNSWRRVTEPAQSSPVAAEGAALLAGHELRALATDRAGNRTVLALGPAVDSLQLSRCTGRGGHCARQKFWWLDLTPAATPDGRPASPQVIVEDPSLPLMLSVQDGTPGLSAIEIEIGHADGAERWEVALSLPSTGDLFPFDDPYQQRFDIEFPVVTLPRGADRLLRISGVTATGARIVGNVIRLVTQPFGEPIQICAGAPTEGLPPELRSLLRSVEPHESQVIVPAYNAQFAALAQLDLVVPFPFHHSRLAATAANADGALFIVPASQLAYARGTAPLASERWLKGPDKTLRCGGNGSGGGEPQDPDFDIDVNPVIATTCNAPASGRLAVRVSSAAPMNYLHVDTFVDDEAQTVFAEQPVANEGPFANASGRPTWARSFEWDVSTHPQGESYLRALSDLRTAVKRVLVDHEPPIAVLDFPAAGSRICANDAGALRLRFGGSISGGSDAFFKLELAPAERPQERYCVAEQLQPGSCTGWQPVHAEDGTLAQTGGELLARLNGLVDAKLVAHDGSGALACNDTRFFLDSRAELQETDSPGQLGFGLLASADALAPLRQRPLLGLAPQGLPRLRTVALTFAATESLSYRATLHATTPQGNAYVPAAELAVLGQADDIEGGIAIGWNGEIGGSAAVDGVYLLRVAATDHCGNSQVYDYLVLRDASAPQLALTEPDAGSVLGAPVVEVRGSVSDANFSRFDAARAYWQLRVQLDNAPEQLLAEQDFAVSPAALLGRWNRGEYSGDGRFVLQASDDLGNSSEIALDFSAPSAARLIAAAGLSPGVFSPNADGRLDRIDISLNLLRAAVVDVNVRDSQGVTVAAVVGNAALAAGRSSFSWDGSSATPLPDGSYRLEISARDAADAAISESAVLSLGIDTTPPQLLDVSPAGSIATGQGVVGFRIDDAGLDRFDARLFRAGAATPLAQRSGAASGLQVLATLAELEEDAYRLEIAAQDRAGNQTSLVREFSVDKHLPTVEWQQPAAAAVLARAAAPLAMVGTASDANLASYEIAIAPRGSENWSPLASGSSSVVNGALGHWTVQQADGDYRLRLSAQDSAGNTASALRDISIDGTPPLAQLSAPLAGSLVGASLRVSGTASDAHLRDYLISVATPTAALAGQWTALYRGTAAVEAGVLAELAPQLADGDYLLRLLVTDLAGLTATAQVDFRIDQVAPSAPLQLRARLQGGDAVLDWNPPADGDLAGYAIYRDGIRLNSLPQAAPHYLDSGLADGTWRYRVTAIDRAGNESAPSTTVELLLDRTPPRVAIDAPLALERIGGLVSIRGSAYAADDFASWQLSVQRSDGSDTAQTIAQGSLPQPGGELASWLSRVYADETAVTLRLEAQDRSGNSAAAERAIVIDNAAPAAPQGLTVTLAGDDAQLAWNPNSETDLRGYLLYRNGRLLNAPAQTPADLRPYALSATAYTDALLADGNHRYVLFAIDQAGNISPPSAQVPLDIDRYPPQLRIDTPVDGETFEAGLSLAASSPHLDIATVRFSWRAVGSSAWNDTGPLLSRPPYRVEWNTQALPLGEYEIRAVAFDQAGQTDLPPPQVRVRRADLTAPAAVSGFQASADGDTVELSWTASSSTDVTGYAIERGNGSSWEELAGNLAATHYSDNGRADGQWVYRVSAVDAGGNRSEPADDYALVFRIRLDQPLTPTDASQLGLNGRSPPGNVQLRRVDSSGTVDLPAQPVDESGRFAFAGLPLASGQTEFTARVLDADGNRSHPASVKVLRDAAPAMPTGLSASASGHAVSLSWNANSETDLLGYRIQHNGHYLLPDRPLATPLSLSSATCCTPEAAADGNSASAWQLQTYFQPVDDESADDPALLIELGSAQIVTALSLDWTTPALASGNVDIYARNADAAWVPVARKRGAAAAHAEIALPQPYRSDALRLVLRSPVAQGSWTDLALAEIGVSVRSLASTPAFAETVIDGMHRYRVSAVDIHALESALTPAAEIAIGDVTPPEAVTLTASLVQRDVSLDWSASASADVVRYELLRDDQVIANRPAAAERHHLDSLRPPGRYAYHVIAYDAFDNASAASNRVSIDVASGLAAPTLVAVDAIAEGAALDLRWQAGDATALSGYQVQRASGEQGSYAVIATTTATQWRDSGLVNGTRYWYRIVATDANGLASAPSTALSGVPRDRVAPPAPLLTYPTTAAYRLQAEDDRSQVCGRAETGSITRIERDGVELSFAATSPPQANPLLPLAAWRGPMEFAADGYHFAALRDGVWQLVDRRDFRAEPLDAGASLPQWSALGLRLYYVQDGRLQVRWPGRAAQLLPPAAASLRAFGIAQDESRLLLLGRRDAGDGSDTLWRVARDGSAVRAIAGIDAASLLDRPLLFSADGRRAAVASADAWLVIDLDQAQLSQTLPADTSAGATWTAPGELAFVRSDGNSGITALWTYSPDTGDTAARATLPFAPAGLDAAPQGSEIALAFLNGVKLFERSSGELRDLTAPGELSAASIRWTASGRLLGTQSGSAFLLQPPGWFCTAAIDLRPGSNRLVGSSTDASGNRSLPAAAITVELGNVALPDLAVSASDVFFVPSVPAPGQQATALFTLRNLGSVAVAAPEIQASLTAPDGSSRPLQLASPLTELGPGAARSLSLGLGVLVQSGIYRLRLEADPLQRVNESDENNNRAESLLSVTATSEPLLDLSTDGAVFAPGQEVRGTVRVTNPGPAWSGSVRLSIVDAGGTSVANLDSAGIASLGYAQQWSQAVQWRPAATLAGDYRLHARLLRSDGSLLAERDAVFAIAQLRQVELSVAARPLPQTAGQPVEIDSLLHFASGNGVLAQASLSTTLYNPAGVEIWSASENLGTLQPGYRMQKSYTWNSAQSAGQYRLHLRLQGQGYAYDAESSLVLLDAAAAEPLSGELELAPTASVVAGTPAVLHYRLRNAGSGSLAGVELRLRLLQSPDQAMAVERFETLTLPAAGQYQGSLALTLPPLSLSAYAATLDARLPADAAGQWRPLAHRGFAVVDGLPPQIDLQQPAADALGAAVVGVHAVIGDAHSPIVQAQVRIDDGIWQPLNLDGSGRHTRYVAGLADGAHRLSVRARDSWGNESTTAERHFRVDGQAPSILIGGVAENELTNRVVHASVEITDSNPDPAQTSILLDGESYIPGSAISAEGAHTLSVRAVDLAGNERLAAVHFRIDTTPPPLAILAPADGSSVAQSAIEARAQTEALAQVTLQAGTFSAQASADADGLAVFANVPLGEGSNTLTLQAHDAAGNAGTAQTVVVHYEAPQTLPLVGTLQPALADLPHGQALQVLVRLRNPGTVALPLQSARLSVYDAAAGLLARQDYARAFAAGEDFSDTPSFASTAWALGSLSLHLEILRNGTWEMLDSQTVNLVDRTAPSLAALAPAASGIVAAPLRLRATASDALSPPVTVEASVDAAAWATLPAEAGLPDTYQSAELALADGAHSYRLRARDSAGNLAELAAVAFTVDSTPPSISITGVADGDLLNHAVTPAISVADAHPASSSITLNGQPYASATPIAASGSYRLRVQALDQAGNEALRERVFTLDLEAPGIVVSEPVPGSTVTTPLQEIAGTTEALAQVHVVAPGLDTTVQAAADGRFRTAAATLLAGSNTLRLRATDTAGNLGAEVQVQVSYQPPPAQLLAAQDTLGPQHRRAGRPIPASWLLRNDSSIALSNVPVRLELRAQDDSSVLAFDSQSLSLPLAGQSTLTAQFASTVLAAGNYRLAVSAQLRNAQGVTGWSSLASTPLTLLPPCHSNANRDQIFREGGPPEDSVFCGDFESAAAAPLLQHALSLLPAPLSQLAARLLPASASPLKPDPAAQAGGAAP